MAPNLDPPDTVISLTGTAAAIPAGTHQVGVFCQQVAGTGTVAVEDRAVNVLALSS